jgi:hypothetical protein
LGRIAFTGALQVIADNGLTAILALCGLGMWAIILPKLIVAPIWTIGIRTGRLVDAVEERGKVVVTPA